MKQHAQNTSIQRKRQLKSVTKVSTTIRALRMMKGLSRKKAGDLLGVSAKSFEQIENGRCYMSPERIERYVIALGCNMLDFHQAQPKAQDIILSAEKALKAQRPPPKVRRNLYKLITKETRVIKILRKRSKLTQYQAAKRCAYANSIFGQIENGRIELPRERINHIVRSLGCPLSEFDKLMKVEILRDEIIEQCCQYLDSLDDSKLESAKLVIKSLMR